MKKILLIEDEENLVELLKVNLTAGGFDVHVALNGTDGLTMAQTTKPDFIILDIRLPNVDGWTISTTLKSSEETRVIPIMILTAASQKSDEAKAKKIGCDFYIVKPFDPIELTERIKNILQ